MCVRARVRLGPCAHTHACVRCDSAPCDMLGAAALWLQDACLLCYVPGDGEAGGCDERARLGPGRGKLTEDGNTSLASPGGPRAEGLWSLRKPNPRPPPSSPPLPSPHFLKKKPLMSPAWQPRGGVPTHALQQAGEKSVSVPLHVKRLTIKTPYGNVKFFVFFFWHNVCTGKKGGMEHSIGSSEGGNKRLRLSGE